ncbi:hypothetical protein [Falsiroseomonas sp. E2-1-a20]|uniref:hypothetical protein n=1 Tax=Falsiroseomonas sp. E2-1-a20 TaxID=3239300 RepID=UPI003F354D89
MSTTTAPTTASSTATMAKAAAMPERLSVRTALLVIVGASVLLWVGLGLVAQSLFG